MSNIFIPVVPTVESKAESAVAKPTSSRASDRDTIYYRGTQMREVIEDICQNEGVSKQAFFWYCLNLGLDSYGHAPIPEPEDGRRKRAAD